MDKIPLKNLTAVIYTRYSTDSKRQKKNSTKRQVEDCVKFCIENKIRILPDNKDLKDRPYSDKATSGTSHKKEALEQLKNDIESGAIEKPDLLVVTDQDRFSRVAIRELFIDFQICWDYNIYFVETDGYDHDIYDLDDDDDQKRLVDKGAVNVTEVRKSSGRSISRLKQLVNEGVCPSRKPFGWDIVRYDEDGNLTIRGGYYSRVDYIPNKEEAKIVKRVFRRFISTGRILPCIEILRDSERYKNNKRITNSQIKTILRQPLHVGDFAYFRQQVGKKRFVGTDGRIKNRKTNHKRQVYNVNPEKHAGMYLRNTHEGIISREVWNKAQDILDKNKEVKTRTRKKGKYLLSGLLVCGNCGAKLTADVRRSKIYYRCPRSSSKAYDDCMGNRYVTEDLIQPVLERDVRRIMGTKRRHIKRVNEWMDIAQKYMDNEKDRKGNRLEQEFNKLARSKKELAILDEKWGAAIRDGKSNNIIEKMMMMSAEATEKIEEEQRELEEKVSKQTEEESILKEYCDLSDKEKIKYLMLFLKEGTNKQWDANVDDYELLGSDSYLDKVALGAVLLDGKQQLIKKAGAPLKRFADHLKMSQKAAAELFTVETFCERLAEYYKKSNNFEFRSVIKSVTLHWTDVDKVEKGKQEHIAAWFRKPNQSKVVTRIELSLQ